jgi:ABC-type multidrug transport system fused ATPase/permease subunit
MSEIGELVELLNTPHEITDTSDKKLKIRDGHIRFDNVTFAYNK